MVYKCKVCGAQQGYEASCTLRTLRLRLRLKKRPLPEEARLYTGTPRYSRLLIAANCSVHVKL